MSGEEIVWRRDWKKRTFTSLWTRLQILGKHNYENAMAAIAIGDAMGVPKDASSVDFRTFQAVEHRIEYVCEKRGVRFYNDSKGTNPDAAIKGIQAMNRRTVLIGGGYDKQSTYDEWIESFDGKVKKLVLLGQTREKIAACARAHGFTDIVICRLPGGGGRTVLGRRRSPETRCCCLRPAPAGACSTTTNSGDVCSRSM